MNLKKIWMLSSCVVATMSLSGAFAHEKTTTDCEECGQHCITIDGTKQVHDTRTGTPTVSGPANVREVSCPQGGTKIIGDITIDMPFWIEYGWTRLCETSDPDCPCENEGTKPCDETVHSHDITTETIDITDCPIVA